ncbi:ThuA domain-containing protein [Cytobacillus oceanisediminis]|uniref:ThuA domain-containing protein n=1 Tax=Cytobacillus oceanisediminis TaxID=665099 RepID=UPI0001F44B4E|nr:trehalose utilization protein ThuA [Cytobacillus oceanisediminis]EFV78726.1 trehalose utilization protein [Bacillus sp. 2_A_57_CT2]MBU8732719.1 trehalose utilization protein ThuA [Cytobacillus oceanisediminis]USK45530.1 trehalose utilization protein ThuA [Cytobacillus oceanisediminis]
MINVLVWNENRHEQKDEKVRSVYPDGIHGAIADFLNEEDYKVKTATLDEPQHGLSDAVLQETDVLVWWGHLAHGEVEDAIAEKVKQRVLDGMGLIVLHSGHFSKIFKALMGTSCDLKWREADEKERIWIVDPSHPIAEGLGEYIELEKEEMYGEHFDIPAPDELVMVSWFEGGEVFRSGCTYRRGKGKIFYFRPGHETYPTYYHKDVQQVIKNAVKWAKPTDLPVPVYGNAKPLERIRVSQEGVKN